jgi:hypothetical protein
MASNAAPKPYLHTHSSIDEMADQHQQQRQDSTVSTGSQFETWPGDSGQGFTACSQSLLSSKGKCTNKLNQVPATVGAAPTLGNLSDCSLTTWSRKAPTSLPPTTITPRVRAM